MNEILEIDFGPRKVHLIKFQRQSAQGRHKHTTKDGKPLNKTQAGRAATKWSIPDGKDKLETGLWKMRKNPYYIPTKEEGNDGWEMRMLPNSVWEDRKIQNKKFISWQEFFEISHYKTPGYYSSERIQWNQFASNRAYTNTALQAFRYSLIDGTNILDLTKAKDQLMYFFALQCKQAFLTNKSDRKKYPRALYYLQEIGAPAQEEYMNNRAQDDAIVSLRELEKKFTAEDLRMFGVILKVGSYNQSVETMYNSLRNFIMGGLEMGNSKTNSQKFNDLYAVLKKKGGRERFDVRFMLQELLNTRVVSIESMNYIWNAKRNSDMEVLGKSAEQVVALLLDEDKKHVKQMLKRELDDKRI